jgi:hypothetical protein
MGRTISGGMKIGRRVIEFGDFPEPVDADLARERVERIWEERGRDRGRREMSGLGGNSAAGLKGLGITEARR